jgi:DNA uptake protein ComE-like DNA-binding protein
MFKRTLRTTLLAILALSGAVWAPAQEEVPTKKNARPQAELEARARYREKNLQTKAKAKAEADAKAVDINRATREELKKLPGITDAYAEAIIAKRPYKSKAELVTKNAIPKGTFQTLRKLVAAK